MGDAMPTYTLTLPAGMVSGEHKARAAREITRVHNEVTGAATYFAQVIVHDVLEGHYFVGGRPLRGRQAFLHGQIRAGRSAPDRRRLLLALRDGVAAALEGPASDVWVYLVDLPARDMIEYGHILPEPGDEAAWVAALPDADRVRMARAGEA
jgi:phenylpyruvate tautomerase PptA (4-oxalocrotonate tautomerase family)